MQSREELWKLARYTDSDYLRVIIHFIFWATNITWRIKNSEPNRVWKIWSSIYFVVMEKAQWTARFTVRENSPALEKVYYTNSVELTLAAGCKDDWQLIDEGEGAEKKEGLKSNRFATKKSKHDLGTNSTVSLCIWSTTSITVWVILQGSLPWQ